MPSLNPDIRRAAAEQLLTLAPDPRFAQPLSDPALLLALLAELTTTQNGLNCFYQEVAGQQLFQAEADQQLQQAMPSPVNVNMPLPNSCLQLLVALVEHCPEAKSLLLQDADR